MKKRPPFNNISSIILTILLDGDHEIGPNDKGIFRTLVVICIGVGMLSSLVFYLCIKVVWTSRNIYYIWIDVHITRSKKLDNNVLPFLNNR